MPKLNDIMEIDTVVRVWDSGDVNAQHYGGLWAPEFTLPVDEQGSLVAGWDVMLRAAAREQGWSLMGGYSGAWMQGSSVLMDPAEFIGGRMERDILAAPGVYVAVAVSTDDDSEDDAGWVVAYRLENEDGTIPGTPDPSAWRA